MEETKPVAEIVEKKSMDPTEVYRRSVRGMSHRQLHGHLRRKARTNKKKPLSMIDSAFAVILSTVFENTKSSGVGGKLSPYLR